MAEDMEPFSLDIRGIGKRYRLGSKVQREIWALRDVSFTVSPGTILGVIGPNGAGKTTLLKVISRVTRPTTGMVVGRGRVVPLLALGAGFQPDLSGRENIFMNAAMYGISAAEVTERLDEIVEFAGLNEFLDVQVKRYSSGMYLRLAFSVAINMRPDILLADEVLAVGDLEFQERCLERVKSAGAAGMSVLFVSHDLESIRRLCDQVLWLSGGEIQAIGDPEEVTAAYERAAWTATSGGKRPKTATCDAGEILFARLLVAGREVGAVRMTDEAVVQIGLRVTRPGVTVRPQVDVKTRGVLAFRSVAPDPIEVAQPGLVTAEVRLPAHLFAESVYGVDVAVSFVDATERHAAAIAAALSFSVYDTDEQQSARGSYKGQIRGLLRPRLDWTIAASHE